MLRLLRVEKNWVEDVDPTPMINVAQMAANEPETARIIQGSFMLAFPDFEHHAVVVTLDPIRAFIRALYEKVPNWLYFAAPQPDAGALLMFLIAHSDMSDVYSEPDRLWVDIQPYVESTLGDKLVAAAQFAADVADDTYGVANRLLEAMEYDPDLHSRLRQRVYREVVP